MSLPAKKRTDGGYILASIERMTQFRGATDAGKEFSGMVFDFEEHLVEGKKLLSQVQIPFYHR